MSKVKVIVIINNYKIGVISIHICMCFKTCLHI